jgi:type I restriction enzyme S subunit
MSINLWELPEIWVWSKAGEIAKIVGGGTPSTKVLENFCEEDGIPWVTPADLTGYVSRYISRGRRNLTERGYKGSGSQIMPTGSVLFSSRAPIGYCAIASNPIATNQGFKSLSLISNVSPEFIYYYLKNSKSYAESLSSGTTFKELSSSKMAELEIPLPPIAEQQRIVAKLEALLTRSTNARNELAAIPKLIERYKQAVLAAAFRGDFTVDWRSENKFFIDENNILQKIKSDHSFKAKFSQIEIEKDIDIPIEWVRISLGGIISAKSGDGLTSKNMDPNGDIPVYGGNGVNGYHSKSNINSATIVIGRVGY